MKHTVRSAAAAGPEITDGLPASTLGGQTLYFRCIFIPDGVHPAKESLWGRPLKTLNPTLALLHRAFYAHPGEVAASEAEAIAAQRAALCALPPSAAKRVEVVASVCTDVHSFLHSQPTLTALAGALFP